MPRALFPVLSAIVLLGFPAGARAADDDVKVILTKAIKAHGGEEALTKYKGSQSKNKGKMVIAGVGEVDFTQEISLMVPDKLKDLLEFEIKNQKITVATLVNGDKASIEVNGKEIEITDKIKEALAEARYMIKAARFVSLLKDKDYEFSLLGEVKVEDKPAVGVRVSSKGHKDINFYFNKETGQLAKVEHRTNDQTGKEVNEERIILEYQKSKEGLPVPKKILIKRDGEKFMEAEVVEAKFFEKLDDSEFKK